MKNLIAVLTLIIATTACGMPRIKCGNEDPECKVTSQEEVERWADSVSNVRNQKECDVEAMWSVCHEDQVSTILYKDHLSKAELALAVIDGKMLIWIAPQVKEERLKDGNIRWTWQWVGDDMDDGMEIVTNDEGIVLDSNLY